MVGCNFNNFTPNNNEKNSEQYEIYNLAVESGYKGTYEEWLESIKGDYVVFQVSNGYIQWKYSEDKKWKDLISLAELSGPKGSDGHTPVIAIGANGNWYIDGIDTNVKAESVQGPQGEPGKNGTNGEKGESAYEIFIKYYPDYTGTEKDWITDVALSNLCNLFGHKWDKGVITTKPTSVVEGKRTYTCETCNEHKYETIPTIEVADAEIYEIDGIKYVNYGSYPQTHVGDGVLIEALNELTETNDRGYYEYEGKEYAKVDVTLYLHISDGTAIEDSVTEWFIVQPIVWRIISENSDGSYQVYSEYLLDSTNFYNWEYTRNIDGVDIYPNNYKYSNVRAWLNGYDDNVRNYTNKGFYDLAFKDSEQIAIITKEVDNSASTTNSSTNKYLSENTFDKIYLLSYQDLNNSNYGFTDAESRKAKVTDYAKATGAYWNTSSQNKDCGYYWLRSPSDDGSIFEYSVFSNGSVGIHEFNSVEGDDEAGVRVACTIKTE